MPQDRISEDSDDGSATAQPLYQQVRATLTARMAEGVWEPGTALPSEFALAHELGVSQGTVRKALDAMAAENLVLRRQGRGTFVPEQTEERSLFHFFRMTSPNGSRPVPQLVSELVETRPANTQEASALGIDPGAPVTVIERVRTLLDRKAALETIVISSDFLPGITDKATLPAALYPFYQQEHGIQIAFTEERLSAETADASIAQVLGVREGCALLVVERIAFDLTRRPVERRISRFLTEDVAYAVTLR